MLALVAAAFALTALAPEPDPCQGLYDNMHPIPQAPAPAPPVPPPTSGGPGAGHNPSGQGAGTTPTAPGAPPPGGPGGGGGFRARETSGTGAGGPADAAGFGGSDLSSWQLWWVFHRDEFLDLDHAFADASHARLSSGGDGAAVAPGAIDPERVRAEIVPMLLAILEKERNPHTLSAAMMALAKIGRSLLPDELPRITAAIRPHLADPVEQVGETAALALGLAGSNAAAPALADLLAGNERGRELVGETEVSPRIRAFAAYGLGFLAQRAAIADVRRFAAHHLVAAVESDAGAARDVRTAALVALSLVALEAGAKSTDSPASSPAGLLAWLGGRLADPRESELVNAYALTTAACVARAAPAELQDAWKARFTFLLRPESPAPHVPRQSAAIGLGMLAECDGDAVDRNAGEVLRNHAREGETFTRRLALMSLARSVASSGSGAGAEGVQRFLLAELRTATGTVRPWCALALGVSEHFQLRAGRTGSDAVRAALLQGAREHRGPGEIGAWYLALGLAQAAEARELLMEGCGGARITDVRSSASLALGLSGATPAVPTLEALVRAERQDPAMLLDSAIALGMLGSDEAVRAPLAMMEADAGLGVHFAAAAALAIVGDGRALERLVVLARDTRRSERDRAYAIAAIGGVCDLSHAPWCAPIASTVNYASPPATLLEPTSRTGVLDLF